MGSYTQFSAEAKHVIYYHFQCDHCEKESGILTHVFTGTAKTRKSGVGRTLSLEEKLSLQERADENVLDLVYKSQNEVEKSRQYEDIFSSKCPHCGKHQSWGGGSLKALIGSAFWVSLGIGFFGFVPTLFIAHASGNWNSLLTLFMLMVFAFLIILVIAGRQRFMILKQAKQAPHKSLPIIDWNIDSIEK